MAGWFLPRSSQSGLLQRHIIAEEWSGQRVVSHEMRLVSRRHAPVFFFCFNRGFAFAKAARLASKSSERYLLVVLTLAWPSQWAIVLRSTPERSR